MSSFYVNHSAMEMAETDIFSVATSHLGAVTDVQAGGHPASWESGTGADQLHLTGLNKWVEIGQNVGDAGLKGSSQAVSMANELYRHADQVAASLMQF
jgi:hypothetical protein